MAEISSVQSIAKKLAIRLLRKAEPVISRVGELADDVFEREPRLKRASNYVQDVVFEKTGRILPRIRASVQGKPIATTQRELFRQLRDLPFDKKDWSAKEISKRIHQGVLHLGEQDIRTISRLSKFFHDLDPEPAKVFAETIVNDDRCLLNINELLSNNSKTSEIIDRIILQDELTFWEKCPGMLKRTVKEYSSDVSRRIERIKSKLQDVEDEKIRKAVCSSSILNPDSEFNKNLNISKNYCLSMGGTEELEKTELLLDAYLCKHDYCSMINGDSHKYYQYLAEVDPELTNMVQNSTNSLREYYKSRHHEELFKATSGMFYDATRLEPLKEFIGKYSQSEPEMVNYLYEKYFLPKLNEGELKQKCVQINRELGTKLFVTADTSAVMLDKIHNELLNWNNVSQGKTKLPSVFDLSPIEKSFIDDESDHITTGLSRKPDNLINIPTDTLRESNATLTIRHEMTHLNDTGIKDLDAGQVLKNKKYVEELANAGLDDDAIEYARTSKNEFIAVAATGDCSRYSKEFKEVLVKLGMPEWVFNLKPLQES